MIPKIIHYCWFGGSPLPPLAQRCIASWRRYLPDYEIRECNEHNFNVNIITYTADAYEQGKYAFVSDYARFYLLYKYGGLYFDTDVEIIKPIDDIISNGCFMGFEADPDGKNSPDKFAPRYSFSVNPGVGFGMTKEHPFMKEMLEHYSHLQYDSTSFSPWYKTIVAHTTEYLFAKGLENKSGVQIISFSNNPSLYVYPSDYFSPINIISRKLHITENTRSIHHFLGNWDNNPKPTDSFSTAIRKRIYKAIPEYCFLFYNKIIRYRYRR